MEGLLTGWRRGDAGGVDREEERDERGGGLGKAVEGEDGIDGGVSRGGLGLRRPEFVGGREEDDVLDKDVFGLMMEGEERPNLFVARSS